MEPKDYSEMTDEEEAKLDQLAGEDEDEEEEAAGMYTGTDVVQLTDQNFDEKIFEAKKHAVVEFYAPWCCCHCRRHDPFLKMRPVADAMACECARMWRPPALRGSITLAWNRVPPTCMPASSWPVLAGWCSVRSTQCPFWFVLRRRLSPSSLRRPYWRGKIQWCFGKKSRACWLHCPVKHGQLSYGRRARVYFDCLIRLIRPRRGGGCQGREFQVPWGRPLFSGAVSARSSSRPTSRSARRTRRTRRTSLSARSTPTSTRCSCMSTATR